MGNICIIFQTVWVSTCLDLLFYMCVFVNLYHWYLNTLSKPLTTRGIFQFQLPLLLIEFAKFVPEVSSGSKCLLHMWTGAYQATKCYQNPCSSSWVTSCGKTGKMKTTHVLKILKKHIKNKYSEYKIDLFSQNRNLISNLWTTLHTIKAQLITHNLLHAFHQ